MQQLIDSRRKTMVIHYDTWMRLRTLREESKLKGNINETIDSIIRQKIGLPKAEFNSLPRSRYPKISDLG